MATPRNMAASAIRVNAHHVNPLPLINSSTRPRYQCLFDAAFTDRSFSQTAPRDATKRRRDFLGWMKRVGKNFKRPLPSSTNYMGAYSRRTGLLNRGTIEGSDRPGQSNEEKAARSDSEDRLRKAAKANDVNGKPALMPERGSDLRPFRMNPHFSSSHVLSEEFRETLYIEVTENQRSVRAVSAQYNVTMERVAAAVRMKQMERDWMKQGKPLAASYSRQVLAMLPQTRVDALGQPKTVHETINDLPVHPKTTQQIFYPTAESRVFTREDAGRVFDPKLLSADKRIPHPQLITLAKAEADGVGSRNREGIRAGLEAEEKAKADEAVEKARMQEAKNLQVVEGRRWDFKFRDVSVDKAGKTGRGVGGVGWRYGMPHEDRKPGQVKIPTTVG